MDKETKKRLIESEDECRDYLFKLKWPDGFECPKCKGNDFWPAKDGRYVCQTCNHETSITSGTMLHKTRVPLCEWVKAVWYLTTQRVTAGTSDLMRHLGRTSRGTTDRIMSTIRKAQAIGNRVPPEGLFFVDDFWLHAPEGFKRGDPVHLGILARIDPDLSAKFSVMNDNEWAQELLQFPRKNLEIRIKRLPEAELSILRSVSECIDKRSKILVCNKLLLDRLKKLGYTCEMSRWGDVAWGTDMEFVHELPGLQAVRSTLCNWFSDILHSSGNTKRMDSMLDVYSFWFNNGDVNNHDRLPDALFSIMLHNTEGE